MQLKRTNSITAIGRTAALHIAFWQYDPWYRRAWLVWPQATAILVASWLVVGLPPAAVPVGNWAKPADCSNVFTPGCAATRRAVYSWDDEVGRPTIANQVTVYVDRSTFRNSAADDRSKLTSALGAYYRYDWGKATDILKSATASDSNVQFLTALALMIPNSTDQARNAEALLREASARGHRQASSVLGRILFAGAGGLPKDETAGRKLMDDAVAAGEPYAMRLAAAGYVSGEFGAYDTVKAVDLLRKAADSGELIAMVQLAYCIETGRGGLTRDAAKTVDYLRRAADAGFEGAQITLARWFKDRYAYRESENEAETIKWYERSYRQGHSVFALAELAYVHRYARAAPWFDTKRSFELLQLCAPYRNAYCHYWLARAYHEGAGTARDYTSAYAHYIVAKELGRQDAAPELQKLDSFLQPEIKTSAAELAKSISAGLKPVPRVIRLQTAETDSTGPSPWPDPGPRPASP
ncbi:sel1 repeat family protein [Bradyrhizobium hipponense]|uniref:Sel1 repeat family protein n=1 Tax=Bradyrhizobium hipponense TaxID=2605638 RepID=A0A5S4YXQ7_9BRAD|nr:tetratricopeptide repeat protein [Bradyrhizobium hipponense]TYO68395.1 sel1 repeat family protein [Bradyrhizobium hipponense]